MLFYVENLNTDEISSEKLLAITNLLSSHKNRKNIVFIEKDEALKIIKSNRFGEIEKSSASDIIENEREIKLIMENIKFHTKIDFSKENEDEITFSNEENYIKISYKKLSGPIDHTEFIAENENDYNFYIKILEFHLRHENRINIKTGFNFRLGAGSHCEKEFKRLEKLNRMCICIVDRDACHPNGPLGSTPLSLKSSLEKRNSTCRAIILNYKEAENLIPGKIIDQVVDEKIKDKIEASKIIRSLEKENNEIKKYFDFKEGYRLGKLVKLDNTYGKFWESTVKKVEKPNKECHKTCGGCGKCHNIDGFGENLLPLTVDYLNRNNLAELKKYLNDENLKNEWNRIAHELLSWGCIFPSPSTRT